MQSELVIIAVGACATCPEADTCPESSVKVLDTDDFPQDLGPCLDCHGCCRQCALFNAE